MAVLESDACVDPGSQRDITPRAGKPLERPWQPTAVALGDPTGQADVLPGTIELAVGGCLLGEHKQSLDSLLGDTHWLSLVAEWVLGVATLW